MQRIDVAERRARLVVRHRLDPAARAADPLAVARSLVCLHATDAVTVFLSIRARSDGVAPADVERALYEDRSIVRMLAMRRTLWAVPLELVPVVFAAATRAVAATQRKRLEGFVRDSGVSTRPGSWITRAGNAAVAAVAARGEAMTTEVTADVPLLAKKLRFGSGKWVVEQSAGARVLPQMAMEGRLVRGRPRGSVDQPAVPLGDDRGLARRADRGAGGRGGAGRAAAPLARGLRAGHRERHALVDRLDAEGDARRARRGATHRGRSRRRDRLRARGRPRADARSRAVCGAAADARPDDDGLEGARLVPRRARGPTLFDSNGNAGPTVWWDGRVVGGWSQRRDGEIALGLLEDVGSDAHAAIEAEVDRLRAWVGDVRFSPGFLPPFQRELAS